MPGFRYLVSIFVFLLTLTGSVSANVLVLGSVNDNVRKHIDRMTPLAQFLETELKDLGITEVQIKVLKNSAQMSDKLRDGSVNLYFDSPLVAASVARSADAVPFLRRWKRGEATYHALFIVPKDSTVQSLDDLVGRRVGFQEPDSTSGYLLPAGMLQTAGLQLQELTDRANSPPDEKVGYVFTGDDKNTLLWLTRGWIDAGATDPRSWVRLEAARPGKFRVIAKSIDVPRQVVIRNRTMSEELEERITTLFEGLHETEEGREILLKFHKTTRFDTFPDGTDQTFDPIYDLLDQLSAGGLL